MGCDSTPEIAETVPTDEALAELAELVLRISREIDPHGAKAIDIVPLNATEALAMRWIESHPGTSATRTAEAMSLRHSNLSVAVRSLVAKGMVERRPDPDDARLIRLHPTDLARDNVSRLHAHWAAGMRAALGDRADGLTTAIDVLRRADSGLRRS
jgi:DNA-binding MarR family transcriptional regulator